MVSNVSFRIDSDLKAKADALFAQLGMNMTTAFNIFLRQSVREGRIPFEITMNTPNAETIAAMLEAQALMSDPNAKTYDVEEALKELKAYKKAMAEYRKNPATYSHAEVCQMLESEPFYSKSNLEHIETAAEQVKAGKVVTKTMEELEALSNE